MSDQLRTPIAFLVFNRPAQTAQVFAAIRNARPQKLFLIADGPRNNEDAEKCAAVRKIISNVDWPCEIKQNFAANNLGCRHRVSSGITWVFENEAKAIILEDDCLPNSNFFQFCAEMLEKYENDPKIMHISGINFQQKPNDKNSYYFSQIPQIWGWATWARAWKDYDVAMRAWPEVRRKNSLNEIVTNPAARDYWNFLFERVYEARERKTDTWDAQWVLACLLNRGLCVTPNKNLVTNIGGGADATRTKQDNPLLNRPLEKLDFPLIHPQAITVDEEADLVTYRVVFGINNSLKKKIRSFAKRTMPGTFAFLKKIIRGNK